MKALSKISPEPGRIYHHRCGPSFVCVSRVTGEPYTAILRNTATGWQIKAHGINMHPDGRIDWDYTTGGEFINKEENKND